MRLARALYESVATEPGWDEAPDDQRAACRAAIERVMQQRRDLLICLRSVSKRPVKRPFSTPGEVTDADVRALSAVFDPRPSRAAALAAKADRKRKLLAELEEITWSADILSREKDVTRIVNTWASIGPVGKDGADLQPKFRTARILAQKRIAERAAEPLPPPPQAEAPRRRWWPFGRN